MIVQFVNVTWRYNTSMQTRILSYSYVKGQQSIEAGNGDCKIRLKLRVYIIRKVEKAHQKGNKKSNPQVSMQTRSL